MATASYRPDYAFQVAFNANPNDATAVATWTDLTSLLHSADSVTRGRQYELDQNQAAAPNFLLEDVNEYLNPANTASPYYPNVLPYRQIVWQGMWPNTGSPTGNLLNSTGQSGSLTDPTFESYTSGSTQTWLTGVGSSSPVIASAPA